MCPIDFEKYEKDKEELENELLVKMEERNQKKEIEIDDKFTVVYGHLNKILIKEGEIVNPLKE